MLPESKTNFEGRLEKILTRRGFAPLHTLSNPDRCPERYLAFLAYNLGVLIWSSSWTHEKKVEVIKKFPQHLKNAGTRKALNQIFNMLDMSVQIREWFEDGVLEEHNKNPFHVELQVFVSDNETLSAEKFPIIRDLLQVFLPAFVKHSLKLVHNISLRHAPILLVRATSIVRSDLFLKPQITTVGRNLLLSESSNASLAKVTLKNLFLYSEHIPDLTSVEVVPDGAVLVPIADSKKHEKRIHITANFDQGVYQARSIGVVTDNGEVFAAGSTEDVFIVKLEKVPVLIGFDIVFESSSDQVQVSSPGERLNLDFSSDKAELAEGITHNLTEIENLKNTVQFLKERIATIEGKI